MYPKNSSKQQQIYKKGLVAFCSSGLFIFQSSGRLEKGFELAGGETSPKRGSVSLSRGEMSGNELKVSWKVFLTGEKAGAQGSTAIGSGVFDWTGNDRRFKSFFPKAKYYKSNKSKMTYSAN